MSEYCDTRSKVPFCICGGFNGNNYKVYSETNGTYHCCNQLPFPILNKNIETVSEYLSTLYSELKGLGMESACVDFYEKVSNDGNLKGDYPELYDAVNAQRLINNEVYKGGTPSMTGNNITCPPGYTPYLIEFKDEINVTPSYRTVCHVGTVRDIDDVSFKVFNFLDSNGKNCTGNVCTTQWEAINTQNIGDVKADYKKKPFYEEWWFWLIISVLFFGVISFIYFVYSYRHRINEVKTERLLNKVSPMAKGRVPSADQVNHLASLADLEID